MVTSCQEGLKECDPEYIQWILNTFSGDELLLKVAALAFRYRMRSSVTPERLRLELLLLYSGRSQLWWFGHPGPFVARFHSLFPACISIVLPKTKQRPNSITYVAILKKLMENLDPTSAQTPPPHRVSRNSTQQFFWWKGISCWCLSTRHWCWCVGQHLAGFFLSIHVCVRNSWFIH